MLTKAHQTASPPVVMFAFGAVSFEVDDRHAAELEDDDDHEHDDQQGVVGTVLEEAADDVLDAIGLHQAVHTDEPEDPEELEVRQAGCPGGPASRAAR